jgi:hypothetical protein
MELLSLLISSLLEMGTPPRPEAIAPHSLAQSTQSDPAPILFRTKRYVVEIFWRRGQPYMSVSNNGFRVIANRPVRTLEPRGVNDQWTTFTANSADYTALVRVAPTGERMIEVRQVRQRIVQEYATFPVIQPPAPTPTNPPADQREETLLSFQTREYAVRVYRQKQELYMNLFNKNNGLTELKRVPVTRVESSDATIYRYDGAATIKAREDYRGQRVLMMMKNNGIQYRGDGY